jgi:thiamine monophosphate kinase
VTEQIALGPGKEFDLVRALLREWGAAATGTGDDAALVRIPADEMLVASTDVSVENVHFRRQWIAPHEIAYRATTAALSDLAAMGARALGILLSLTLPDSWRGDVVALARGVGDAVRAADTVVLGGDLSRGGELSLSLTVLGSARNPLRRSAVRPGDRLYVTGRLAAASGVHITLSLDPLSTLAGIGIEDAASSGEEYELLVAARELDVQAFEDCFALPLTEIGRAEQGAAEVSAYFNGRVIASPGGFDHFS